MCTKWHRLSLGINFAVIFMSLWNWNTGDFNSLVPGRFLNDVQIIWPHETPSDTNYLKVKEIQQLNSLFSHGQSHCQMNQC